MSSTSSSPQPAYISCTVNPDIWGDKITSKLGRPSRTAISILAECCYWFRPKKIQDPVTHKIQYLPKIQNNAWQTTYSYLEKKFRTSHETIRRNLKKLEDLGVLKRQFHTVNYKNKRYNNRLFITINHAHPLLAVFNLTSPAIPNTPATFTTPPSPQKDGDIYKNYNIKSRSNTHAREESTFEKKFDSKEGAGEEKRTVFKKIGGIIYRKQGKKPLKEFHPVHEDTAATLRSMSERGFSTRFINMLILRLAAKYPSHEFGSKEAFLSYMLKALKQEMREEAVVSNETFRFKVQDSDEIARKEKYLREVEYEVEHNPDTSLRQKAQLRKKIAARFESNTAYELLTKGNFINRNQALTVVLPSYITLTDNVKTILINEINKVYGNISILFKTTFENTYQQKKLDAEMDFEKKRSELIAYDLAQGTDQIIKIKGVLVNMLGESIYYSWFRNIHFEKNPLIQTFTLQTESLFKRDWLQSNYWQHVLLAIQKVDPAIKFVSFLSHSH